MRNVKICILICMILILPLTVRAEEYTYEKIPQADTAVQDGWDKLVDSLPEDVREELDDMELTDVQGIREKIDLKYWIRQILSGAAECCEVMLPGILPLFSIMLFMAAVELSIQNAPSANLQKSFLTCASLVSAVMIFGMTNQILEITRVYLERICSVMNLLTPMMEVLYLAGGNLTEKAITTEAVMLGVTLVGNFTGQLLAPLTNLLFTLSCLAGVCSDVKIAGFTNGLRKLIMRLWQYGTLLFSFLLSVQSVLAKSADSLAAKTARFAIGSFIPVAGGVIAEAFSTLKEGVGVLRNAAGIGGIIVILLLLIPGIVPLILYKCSLGIAETAADALNLGRMRSMLGDVHGIVDMLFAFVLYTSLMFVLAIIVFTKSQVGV